MTRNARFAVGVLVAGVFAGVGQFAGGDVLAQRSAKDECSLPKQGAFSVGYVAPHDGEHYRCLAIFDDDMKPAGAAWVKVVKDGRFIVKD